MNYTDKTDDEVLTDFFSRWRGYPVYTPQLADALKESKPLLAAQIVDEMRTWPDRMPVCTIVFDQPLTRQMHVWLYFRHLAEAKLGYHPDDPAEQVFGDRFTPVRLEYMNDRMAEAHVLFGEDVYEVMQCAMDLEYRGLPKVHHLRPDQGTYAVSAIRVINDFPRREIIRQAFISPEEAQAWADKYEETRNDHDRS